MEESMGTVRVSIKVEIDPPGALVGEGGSGISHLIEHRVHDGRLLVAGVEEAIEIVAQKVIAMAEAVYPDRRGEIKE
jgi:hypothetical protein